jgi:hypothetical protein
VNWRQVIRLWLVLALLAVPPVLLAMLEHGLCENGGCASPWLEPLLELYVCAGIIGTILIWARR